MKSYGAVQHLPARGGHAAFHKSLEEWSSIVTATSGAGLGLVVSDVGELEWSVFWQRRADSQTATPHILQRRIIALITCAAALLETTTHTASSL